MPNALTLSTKQNEYLVKSTHRWNVKSGAVRSGKSYVDTAAVIPMRIRERVGKPGLVLIMGVSRDSIERNVLQPMREIYTEQLVGTINNRNMAYVCGEMCYCLGAEKISQLAKIQGMSIKYCYGDEVAKWNKDVFQMLKSRLDKSYSCFDGAFNPEAPTHWLKEFIDDETIDIYVQKYRIFDNPYLPKEFVDSLCKEYAGTIWYDRLIEGEWKRAEGAIYRKLADNANLFRCRITDEEDEGVKTFKRTDITSIDIGLDFGGNQSGHAFVARGYTDNMNDVIVLMSRRIMAKDTEDITPQKLESMFCDFIGEVIEKYSYTTSSYSNVESVYWDNAESVLGKGIQYAVEERFPWINVKPARKAAILDRIRCTCRLIGAGRLWLTDDAETVKTALSDAVWNRDKANERLDDGSSDIDSLDAFEYTFERDIKYLLME